MPTATPTLAYATEEHNGATGLYSDPARRHFLAVVFRPLNEGEVVEGATYNDRLLVTWAKAQDARVAA